MSTVSVGVPAPEFRLPSNRGTVFSLFEQHGGSNLVLFFLDHASGSADTLAATSFRDACEFLAAERTAVVGIGTADLEDLRAFQEVLGLPFELLSDDGSVSEEYGVRVRRKFGPLSRDRFRRSTFLLDRTGVIRQIFRDVNLSEHINEVLASLDTDL